MSSLSEFAALDAATFDIVDTRTGAIVKSYPGTQRNKASAYRDRLDRQYGCARYAIRIRAVSGVR